MSAADEREAQGGPGKDATPLPGQAREVDADNAGSVARRSVDVQPTTAVQFAEWWLKRVGRLTITHIHPEERTLREKARNEGRVDATGKVLLTDAEQAQVCIEYGNSRSYPLYHAKQTRGAAWLAHNEEGFNTYFSVACSRELGKGEGRNKTLKKVAIAFISAVWCDIDPPAHCGDLAAWRAAKLAELEQHPSAPPPSIVFNSGNGLQSLWLLREPFAVDGKRERWEDFERTTGALVDVFGADPATWNADRILRLPFTTNWPDKLKREKGRVPCSSSIILWHPEGVYGIGDLPRLGAHPKQKKAAPGKRSVSRSAQPATLPEGDLMVHLADKQFGAHHQPLLHELASWKPEVGRQVPIDYGSAFEGGADLPPEQFETLSWTQELALYGRVFQGGTLLPQEQFDKLSERTRELALYGARFDDCTIDDRYWMAPMPTVLRDGEWVKLDRNGQSLAFAASALKDGVAPSKVAGMLVHAFYGISAHCLDQGDPVRAAVRTVGEAIRQLPDEGADVDADIVELRAGFLDRTLNEVQEVLLRKKVSLFQRAGQLVMPIRLDQDSADDSNVKRRKGSILLHRPNASGLVSILAGCCRFVREVRKKKVPADPTAELANVFLAGRERWQLPSLDGITGVPVFRPDGSILTKEGYDATTRLFFDPAGMTFPDVADAPTREDALAALEVLKRPFRGFPIPRPECRSALLAAQITVVVTPTVDAVPAVGVSASLPGFGKTMLQRCIGALAMGADPASMNQSSSDEEDAKRLDAVLLAGDPIIAIDNVTRPVGGDVLCSIVTNSVHKVRVLGRSEVPQVSARVQVIVNGNHLAFWGDMCRRVLLVVIEDDAHEKPEERHFDFDPVQETLAARGAMVAAALTILRAWHSAGRPRPDGHKPMGSFEGWECVRLALLWLGQADPRDSQALVMENDPQRELDADLLALLWRSRGEVPFRAVDLRNFTHDEHGRSTPLGDALLDGGPWNARKAGNRLRLLVDRWVGDVRLRRARKDHHGHGQQYLIEHRGQASAAPEPF